MGVIFADMDEVELAYSLEQVDIHAQIKLLVKTWYDDNGNRLPEAEEAPDRDHRRAGHLQPHPAARDPVRQLGAGQRRAERPDGRAV